MATVEEIKAKHTTEYGRETMLRVLEMVENIDYWLDKDHPIEKDLTKLHRRLNEIFK